MALSPGRHQATIKNIAGILLIGLLIGIYFLYIYAISTTTHLNRNPYIFIHENAFEYIVC